MTLILVFLSCVCLGSFLNVLIDRLSTGRSFVKGRSYCEKCKKELKTLDLIPLLSYILLKGRCRYCKTKIPFRLFTVELLTGILGIAIYLLVINSFVSLLVSFPLFVILYAFLGIFIADIIYGIIPDLLVILSFISSFVYVWLLQSPLDNHIISAVATLAFFFFLFILTKGKGMGMGDVKLSFVLGFLLGFPSIIVSLYLAFLTGAAISIILVIWKKLRFFGGTIPFGPFLVASSAISLFYGPTILSIFVQNFL